MRVCLLGASRGDAIPGPRAGRFPSNLNTSSKQAQMTASGFAIKPLSLLYQSPLRRLFFQEGGSSVFSCAGRAGDDDDEAEASGLRGRVARAARARFKCAWHDRLKAAGADLTSERPNSRSPEYDANVSKRDATSAPAAPFRIRAYICDAPALCSSPLPLASASSSSS